MRTLTPAQVQEVYGRHAPHYDLWANLTESRARRRVLDIAGIHDGDAVLEVAVGSGLLFVELLARNPHGRTRGIDLTPSMVEVTRGKAERSGFTNWEVQVGDARALDYANASFDVVVSMYMFDLLGEAEFGPVLAEFARVLRPRGRLVVANLTPSAGFVYRLWSFLYGRNPAWVGGCRGVDLTDAVQNASFTIEVRERVDQLGMSTEILSARRG